MNEISTRCVHDGTIHDQENGGINSPIFTSSSYEFIDREDTVYPRYLNTPNEKAVAKKMASLENCEDALVFSSGMAAISTVLFTFLSSGDHIVFQKGLYGGTTNFIVTQLHKFGIEYTFAASQSVTDIMDSAKENTRLIYVETPSNPLLNITDLEAVAKAARIKSIPTVVDNTFASPINQQPGELGIDIIIHSATKYIGGHSDICAGVVAASSEHISKIRTTGLNFGGSLNAITLYLVERSLKTLDVRMQRINKNGQAIAEFLALHPAIACVNYPGLPEHAGYDIARRQMTGFGGMLSFELKNADGIAFQKRLQIIKPSMSLGGVETIVSSPANTSHRHLGVEGRKKEGIAEGLIRMSIGIESYIDLIEDLDQALQL